MSIYRYWHITLDKVHGLGIVFGYQWDIEDCFCFYEDQTLQPVKHSTSKNPALDYLLDITNSYYYRRLGAADSKKLTRLLEKGQCQLTPGNKDNITVLLSSGTEQFRILVEKDRYSCGAVCSCKKRGCIHIRAASLLAAKRVEDLQHRYVVSDLAVDKTLFLEPALWSALLDHDESKGDFAMIASIRKIIGLLDAAHSRDYYQTFHQDFLDISPGYRYDSRFLEDNYRYLLLALFETPGYSEAVLEPGGYADPEKYEDRQHRSNRTCLKRVLKDYGRTVKELDQKGDYTQDPCKEFLLKFRGDYAGLLRYYAEGKETLEESDLPFLEEITAATGMDPARIQAAALKLDPLGHNESAAELFRRLAGRLPYESRVDLFSRLQTITVPMKEMQALRPEDQLRLINSVPLTEDNFRYIMEHILAERGHKAKGRFILNSLRRFHEYRNTAFKNTILSAAASLPDSRLLASYVLYCLNIKEEMSFEKGVPEKELSLYFDCGYEFVNEGDRFYTIFQVMDSESDYLVLFVRETGGKLDHLQSPLGRLAPSYSPEMIRELCLKGHENDYRVGLEQNQDAVDAFLFEKKHRQFSKDYREFCASLTNVTDEKLLFAGDNKAEIEWQICREEDKFALAFRVGHNKKYVVKDAAGFIQAFKTCQTASYGRDLILTHDPDNLREDDAAVIRLLMAARFTKGLPSARSNKRYITVSGSLLSNILDLLTGRTVCYRESPCLLRMDPCSMRLKISDKYVLSTDLDDSCQEFINLDGKGFLLTRNLKNGDSVLDRMDVSMELIRLTELILSHPGVSVKPILKDFRKEIYARFFEAFDVDKKVLPEFSMGRIRLNTYFDFESPAITARTEIFKEGSKITASQLTEHIDRVRYEMLQNYLGILGFEEGRLSDESRVLSFFKMDFTRMKELTNVYLSENLQNKELGSIGKPVIRVSYQNNLMRVFLEQSEYSAAELEQIIAGLRKKKKYILLDGTRIIDLDNETARDFGEAVKDFDMDPRDLYRKKPFPLSWPLRHSPMKRTVV